MTELEKLKLLLPDIDSGLLDLLIEDAEEAVSRITNRTDVTAYPAAIRAVAVILCNKLGREGQSAYSAGGVSISYQELPDAVKGLLPPPLASVGGRIFERVAPAGSSAADIATKQTSARKSNE